MALPAWAQESSSHSALRNCLKLESQAALLKCTQDVLAAQAPAFPSRSETTGQTSQGPQPSGDTAGVSNTVQPRTFEQNFERQWALEDKKPGDRCWRTLCAYRPSYLIVRHSDSPNRWPSSSSPGHSVTTPVTNLPMEEKFQISFKTLAQTWDDNRWQLWLAYSQQNQWQLFNSADSRPFRETNYEPEIFVHRRWASETPDYKNGLRFVGLGLNHQSNGQSNPLSRSWNRIVASAGFSYSKVNLVAKLWHRVKENAANDDNPGIENYLGRGELTANWAPDWLPPDALLSLRLRHSLNHSQPHGSAQVELALPALPNSHYRVFFQLFRGYGESMIDFNHAQTTFGLGLGVIDW